MHADIPTWTPEREADYTPAPCRSLMVGGVWVAPEHERPRDWRERAQPKDVAEPKPKEQWDSAQLRPTQRMPRHREKGPSKPRARPDKRITGVGAGRPSLADTLGPRMIELHREGKTSQEIAEALGCSVNPVNRHLRATVGSRMQKHVAKAGTKNAAGYLTILAEIQPKWESQRLLSVQCVCGSIREVSVVRFFGGCVESCGCMARKRSRKTEHDAEILRRRAAGESIKSIAKALGMDRKTVTRSITEQAAREATA